MLKDYYYFLGLSKDATNEEIKKSYRKLSLKYHPDKNDNDEFFTQRFREITEAYETLIDPEKRTIYNAHLGQEVKNRKSDLPPVIKNFHVSKIRARLNEEIKISWQTYHADLVKVMPFGLEQPQGERMIRIKEFDKNGHFQILLQATNTYLNQSLAQAIVITEISSLEVISSEISEEIFPKDEPAEVFYLSNRRILALSILLIVVVMLYLMTKNAFV